MGSTISSPAKKVKASKVWVHDFYKSFDAFDLDNWFTKFFKADTVVSLCNNPLLHGSDEVRTHFEQQRPFLTSMKHKIIDIDVLPDRIYVQNEVTFIVKADPKQEELKMKVVCLFWKKINENKTTYIDVYFDQSPVSEKMKMYL